MVTIGGVDKAMTVPGHANEATFVTPDPSTLGLGAFDLGKLAWKSSYAARPSTCMGPPEIRTFYSTK